MPQQVKLRIPAVVAAVFGVVVLVTTGALSALAWTALAVVGGWFVGLVIERFVGGINQMAEAEQLLENSSKTELLREARRLRIDGRTQMTRKELVSAIVEARSSRRSRRTPAIRAS